MSQTLFPEARVRPCKVNFAAGHARRWLCLLSLSRYGRKDGRGKEAEKAFGSRGSGGLSCGGYVVGNARYFARFRKRPDIATVGVPVGVPVAIGTDAEKPSDPAGESVPVTRLGAPKVDPRGAGREDSEPAVVLSTLPAC